MEIEHQRAWFIVRRWQTYAAEMQVLLIRVVAVIALYSCQLVHHFLLIDQEQQVVNARFQQGATLVALLLLVTSALALAILLKRWLPWWLSFVTTFLDLAAVTACVALAGGPLETSLVTAFYLIIAMAGMRFDVRLVWCATLGAMIGYMASVGSADQVWFDANHEIPLVQQGVTLVTLAAIGLTVGQIVRSLPLAAEEFRLRVAAKEGQ